MPREKELYIPTLERIRGRADRIYPDKLLYTQKEAAKIMGCSPDYLRELGVTYLHLMPLLTPRPGDSDGGYAVADYRTVRPDLGTMEDLEHLAGELRAEGISLVVDLVLNHVAAEHEWAVRARAGEQRYRDYFYIRPARADGTAPTHLPTNWVSKFGGPA